MYIKKRQVINTAHISPRLIITGHTQNKHPYAVIRNHGTADWLLIYTLKGAGCYTHSRETWHSGPGDITLYPPSTPHNYRIANNADTWEILWAHFLLWPHWHDLLAWPDSFHGLRRMHLAVSGMRAAIGQKSFNNEPSSIGAA